MGTGKGTGLERKTLNVREEGPYMEKPTLMTIFAHQDDETFSAGGTLAKYGMKTKGWAVSVTEDPNRIEEFEKACSILGVTPINLGFESVGSHNQENVIRKLIGLIRTHQPTFIITHIPFDYHREHRAVHSTVLEAVEWASHTTSNDQAFQVEGVFGAETTVLIPFPEIYIDITETNDHRLQAIHCYESQSHKGGKGFYSKFHGTRTKLRGIQAEVEDAEAFIRFPISKSGSFKPKKHYDGFEEAR